MIICKSFEAGNRHIVTNILETLSNKYHVIDWNITYDLHKKSFVLIVRFHNVMGGIDESTN